MIRPAQNQYAPDFVTPPGETLFEILEENGMSQAEFADRTGRPKKTINEIIKGKAAITPETALQFEKVLGTPASFWNNREHNFREWLARQEERKSLEKQLPWMKQFPVRVMIKKGWIKSYEDKIAQLTELLRFFAIASPENWEKAGPAANFRQSPTFTAQPAAVSAWLRKGEIEAHAIECEPYKAARFQAALLQARALTKEPLEIFVPQLTQICAAAGVAVVFVPEMPGTRTCGATRWLTPTKALIMLSLRYKTDDQLWFTFFHEAGHILLHGKRDVFLEAEQKANECEPEKEEQANRFAADILIPLEQYHNLSPAGQHFGYEDIEEFARRIGIAPGIVVGRLQHDARLEKANCNRLKRRFQWVEDKS